MQEVCRIKILICSSIISSFFIYTPFSMIKSFSNEEQFIILATGKYISEGFDESRLDTLFLTMLISWKGLLQQYAGRLQRMY